MGESGAASSRLPPSNRLAVPATGYALIDKRHPRLVEQAIDFAGRLARARIGHRVARTTELYADHHPDARAAARAAFERY